MLRTLIDLTPHIDRLAERGVRFDDATVQWPSTWPSMASMLTGTYPATTGVVWSPKRPLDWYNRTIAEVLHDSGYHTGAVVSNVSLGKRMQFQQGFDWFVESWSDASSRDAPLVSFSHRADHQKQYTNATLVTDLSLRWLEQQPRETPVFLWVHYFDPHGPYVPPDGYASLYARAYAPRPVALESIPETQRQTPPGDPGPTNDLAFYMTRYDQEIRYLDDEVGRLIDAIARRWHDHPGLLVFTADHGESLDEHGNHLAHGKLPFQPDARVPLILTWPGQLPGGRVVRTPVALVALMPTLLELIGVPVPQGVEAASLLPWIHDRGGEPPAIFGHSGIRKPPQAFVRQRHFKLVRFNQPDEIERFGGAFALYDLESDPGETRNAIDEHPREAERLRQELEAWVARTWREPARGSRGVEFDPRERELLRQLGYSK